MLIDYTEISEAALLGIAQQYVETRISEVELDVDFSGWTDKVVKMVKTGKLLVEYSENNDSVYLVSPDEIEDKYVDDHDD